MNTDDEHSLAPLSLRDGPALEPAIGAEVDADLQRLFEARGDRQQALQALHRIVDVRWPSRPGAIVGRERVQQVELFYDRFYDQHCAEMRDPGKWIPRLSVELDAWAPLLVRDVCDGPVLQPVTPEAFSSYFDRHWRDPSHDEALAQLLAALEPGLGPHPCEKLLLCHLQLGEDLQRRAPEQLFSLARSPLRAVLALLCCAGLELRRSMPALWRWLSEVLSGNQRLQHAVAGCSRVPPDLFELLVGVDDLSLQWALATHPRTPDSAFERLAESRHPAVLRALATSARTPVDVLEGFARDGSDYLQFLVARHPKLGEDVLVDLLTVQDFNVWQAAASNPNFSPGALKALSDDEALSHVAANTLDPATQDHLADQSPRVSRSLACNPNANPRCLIRVAKSNDAETREGVAQNPAAPATVLALLAKDMDETVRAAVAGNGASASTLLCDLARDVNDGVRAAVARNRQAPSDELALLALDPGAIVRRGVAENPEAPEQTLLQLSQDSSADVRCATAKNERTPLSGLRLLAADPDPKIRHGVSYPHRPLGELAQLLARDSDDGVRLGIAANPEVPPAVLETLVSDRSERVRAGLAWNRSSPRNVLEQLAADPSTAVRERLANNFNIPDGASLRLARDPDVEVRRCLAHSKFGDSALELLVRDPDVTVRMNVASCCKSPRHLDKLLRDSDPQVQSAAATNCHLFLESGVALRSSSPW